MARSGNYQTKGRQLILGYLSANADKIITAADIYHYMEVSGNKVNQTTVYRYLDQLEVEGKLIKYIADRGEKSGYQFVKPDGNCHEHLHLQCVKCGKVIHLDCDFMDELKTHILEHHSFLLQCDNSVLYGLCDSCKK